MTSETVSSTEHVPSRTATPGSAQIVSAEPITACVRLYLNDILKFDPASGFTADIYLGVACVSTCGDPQADAEPRPANT